MPGRNPRRFPTRLEPLEPRVLPATDVLLYHGGLASTGQNLTETTLDPTNVNVNQFGKLYSTPLDGQVYAQPLYKTAVNITTGPDRGVKDIALVATQHNTVYAINSLNGQVLWSRNLGPSVPQSDVLTGDITDEIGITSTGAIDGTRNIWFVVAKTKNAGNRYVQRLHALNLSDGSEALGGPAVIADTTDTGGSTTYNSGPYTVGNGDGSIRVGGQDRVYFNALRQNQRSALTLDNGNLYIAWASHGDNGPYHGWLLRYAVGGSGLNLTGVLNTTPTGGLGGIWESGGGVTIDPQGFLYVTTGNGTFDRQMGPDGLPINGNYGNAFLKIANDPTSTQGNQNGNKNGWGLKVIDFFVPYNQESLNAVDDDLGSGGVMLLPDGPAGSPNPRLMLAGGKEGKLYLLDRDDLGGFGSTADRVVQAIPNAADGIFSTPSYHNGTVYVFGGYANATGSAFALNPTTRTLVTNPTSRTADDFGYVGWTATISADGINDGVLWVLDRGANELRAYDAANLGTKLYASSQAPNDRDAIPGLVQKFATPTVADGKVFVAMAGGFAAYGLLMPPTSRPAQPTSLIATAASGRRVNLTWADNSNLAANQEDSTTLERSTDGGTTWAVIGTVGQNATSFLDLSVAPGATYAYRVFATNALGASQYSPAAFVTTPAPTTDGDGLLGTYFDNSDFTNPLLQRVDPVVDFDFGPGSPDSAMGVDSFSIRWTGQIEPKYSETYTFTTTSDDGIRLVVNGVTVIDAFFNQSPTEHSGTIALVAGQRYDIRIEYFEDGYGSVAKLEWASASQARQVVPKAALHSNAVSIPNAPTGLAGAADSGTRVNLSWADRSNNESGFAIYRATDSAFTRNVAVFQVPANVAAYQDVNGLINGVTYYYMVIARGPGGDSAPSNVITVLTPTPPVTPSNSRTTLVSTTRIDIVWSDNSNNETQFEIDRRTGSGGTYERIAVLPANSTSFSDTGLTPGTLYNYHVRAVNVAGYADFTGVNTQTLTLAPSNLTARGGSGVINLSWSGTPGANKYNIYRGTSPGTATLLLSNSGGTTYADFAVSGGQRYYYFVTAVNSGGESARSAEVSAAAGANGSPVIVSMASAPSPATGTAATFSVVATDDGGEAGLEYTWELRPGGKPVGAPDPVFGPGNGTNAGKSLTVTFSRAGAYSFALEVSDGTLTVESVPFIVQVNQTLTSVVVAPASATLSPGATQPFSATAFDQFGNALGTQPAFTWALASGTGSVSAGGLYTAPAAAGSAAVRASATVAGVTRTGSAAVTVAGAAVNFPNGFAGATGLRLNGGAAVVGSALRLTPNAADRAGSAFTTAKVGVAQFSTAFRFQLTGGGSTADGFTFTIQGQAPTALGSSGGGLGYGPDSTAGPPGVASSVAVKFDLYSNQGEGYNSTGLYLNGVAPTVVGSVDLTPSGIDLHSGHAFNVAMTYDGAALTVRITDATTNATFTRTYAVNIPQIVGGGTAYVGFTGGTGGQTAQQQILNWTYAAGAAPPTPPPAAPSSLAASAAASGQINLTWADNSTNEAGFQIERSTAGGPFALVTIVAAGAATYSDAGLAAGTAYTYRVRAVNAGGASAYSNAASATTPAAPAGAISVNFQDALSQGYAGYLADTGARFAVRGNGYSYGWNADNSASARNRNVAASPDERYDTLTHMQKPENPNAFWEIAVPNGSYTVRVVAGDPGGAVDALYKIAVEGVTAIDSGAAPLPGQFFEGTVTVTVADGRLTVGSAAGAVNNKINFLDITPTAPAALRAAPAAKAVSPAAKGQPVWAVAPGLSVFVIGLQRADSALARQWGGVVVAAKPPAAVLAFLAQPAGGRPTAALPAGVRSVILALRADNYQPISILVR